MTLQAGTIFGDLKLKNMLERPESGQKLIDPIALLWILLFLNASGTWTSWLVMGPYLVADKSKILAFGVVALIRQLFAFAGTLTAETWKPRRSTRSYIVSLEWALVALNTTALSAVWLLPDSTTLLWASAWSLIRFFLGGFGLVLSFRLIMLFSKHSSSNSIAGNSLTGQLAVNQGSVIIGAALSFLFAFFPPPITLTFALALDSLSSLIYLIWLYRLEDFAEEVSSPSQRLMTRLKETLHLGAGLPLNQSAAFLASLLALTSLPTIFLYVSRENGAQDFSQFYSTMNLVNGAFVILAALKMSKSTARVFQPKSFYTLGVIAVSMASAFYLSGTIKGYGVFMFTGLLSFGSTAMLLAIHRLVIAHAAPENVTRTRSSMALYLNIIFGSGELICALLGDAGLFNLWIVMKLGAGLLGLALVLTRNETEAA